MKKILLLCFVTISIVVHSQDKYGIGSIPFNNNGEVVFSEIVQLDDNVSVLYANLLATLTDLFVSSKDAIQFADKETHTLIAKGVNFENNVEIQYTLKIQVKDKKYRIEMYNCIYKAFIPNLPPTIWTAEDLTDNDCINKKGECKKTGKGYARRLLIDTKNEIFFFVKNELTKKSTSNNEDW